MMAINVITSLINKLTFVYFISQVFNTVMTSAAYLFCLGMVLFDEGVPGSQRAVNHGLMTGDLRLQFAVFLVKGLRLVQVLPQLVRRCKGQMFLNPLLLRIQLKHKLVEAQRFFQCLPSLLCWISQCSKSKVQNKLFRDTLQIAYKILSGLGVCP